ncbi:MAG: GLPGLI family protein [Bacteroidetes bacterium]|nr:GLPGLI family protein [Bacteroidota bacterium]
MLRFFLMIILLIPVTASAQMGTVRYAHTYSLEFGTFYEYKEATSDAFGVEYIPPATHATISRNMAFSPTSSLMYPTDKVHFEPGKHPITVGREHIDTTFVNLENSTYIESRVIGSKLALVSDQLPTISWRLSTEERVHMGYRVLNATAITDSSTIEAWFTPDILVPAGPGLYGGLPGLILILSDEANGESYTVESIEMDLVSKKILPPTRGHNMSNQGYRQLRKEYDEKEQRSMERQLRDIEEGRMVIIKRGE